MVDSLKLKVLGCDGGEMAGYATPSILLDESILLDAGSFGGVLDFDQQLAIDHVVLSHAHLDHSKDLAFFSDLIIGHRNRPVKIHASAETLKALRRHFFNNQLWPDFFVLPSPEAPVLREAPILPGKSFTLGSVVFRSFEVNHPVPTLGFIVRSPTGTFIYSGDTGPTDEIWHAAKRLRNLKLIMVECKFPSEMQLVADAAGHLTPQTLARELQKLGDVQVPVYVYHIKPERHLKVVSELKAMGDERLKILKVGDEFLV